jgi:hypothetical protein
MAHHLFLRGLRLSQERCRKGRPRRCPRLDQSKGWRSCRGVSRNTQVSKSVVEMVELVLVRNRIHVPTGEFQNGRSYGTSSFVDEKDCKTVTEGLGY